MAIEKMELVSLVGPVREFDRVVGTYLTSCDIHIENALSMLKNVHGLYPFSDGNEAAELLGRLGKLLDAGGIVPEGKGPPAEKLPLTEIAEIISAAETRLSENEAQCKALADEQTQVDQVIRQLEHMLGVDINLDELFGFQFVKFRFGRLPRAGYKKLRSYLQDIDAFFVEGEVDQQYIYGVYFMPADAEERIDGIFSSLYFERIRISGESHGTPLEAYHAFVKKQEMLAEQRSALENQARELVRAQESQLIAAYKSLIQHQRAETVKKYAAHTRESFYVVGWVAERDVEHIKQQLADEPDVIVVEEEPDIIKTASPPVRLSNRRIFRPFESFVEMYGLPSYEELDPTPLFAISYVFLFGIMFGDLGHGLVLAVLGFLYYLWKRADIGAIVSLAGCVSAVFGVLYGSVFGNEEILPELVPNLVLIQPMEEINRILILTVGLGVGIIFLSMFMNLINAIKNRDWGRFWFDQNGIAGMVFYGCVLVLALSMVLGFSVSTPVLAIGILVSLLAIYLKEPLSGLIAGEKDWMPRDLGDYLLGSFFELFDIVLTFATNTISFVRLGAFALAHAGMMSVVYIFADMTSGVGSVIVLVLGNILVMGLEGLVVGIQALRLEFYEMFSRFFAGEGRPFVGVGQLR